MRKIAIYLTLAIFFNSCFATNDSIIIDQYMSPYAGTALNLSILHTYMALDDKFLPSSAGKTNVSWVLGRSGKFILEDIFLDGFLMVFQHEVFGHGYRLREFDFSHISYAVRFGYGFTGFSDTEYYALSYPKQAAVSSGGMEADSVLSAQIRQNWVLDGKIDRRDAIFYLRTAMDQPEYIFGSVDSSFDNTSNDVNAYVQEVNAWYGNQQLTKNKLRNYAIWDLLDFNLYQSIYSIGMYLVVGSPNIDMLMLNIKNYKYLPTPRLLLTPYGPEFQLQNYVVTPSDKLLQINLRYGNNSDIQSYGIDFFMRPIYVYEDLTLYNKLYLWYQPKFLTQNTAVGVKKSLGLAEFLSADYKLYKAFSAFAELGYKTAGYIQGNPLGNSWVWRLGISLRH